MTDRRLGLSSTTRNEYNLAIERSAINYETELHKYNIVNAPRVAATIKTAGGAAELLSEDTLFFCSEILRNIPERTDGTVVGFYAAASDAAAATGDLSFDDHRMKNLAAATLEKFSAAGFTPEVVEYFGAEYFGAEKQKKRNKESAKESAARADKKKRKPQFSPADDQSSAEEMDVSPTGGLTMVPLPPGAPPNLEGVLSPEHLRTDMELEVLHQETVQKTAQIIDAIRSFDIYALSWVEHNLKECKKHAKHSI
jgi:hypothetical protein